jgi:hypothetical protein
LRSVAVVVPMPILADPPGCGDTMLCDSHKPGKPGRQAVCDCHEAEHAKSDQVRMARDVATMFDELKALADRHAEMHADRARLQAELEKGRAELEQARRPWWRRLVER